MGTLHDEAFPVRVNLGGVWLWLHFPPHARRVTTTKDRRVALSVNDPAFAPMVVAAFEKAEGRQVDGWQCVPMNPKDDRVIREGGGEG